ncbi:hypothetical protein KUF71_016524 [Frankliniella fusca]|uniref:Uncharacterized protein n=1 Tax=Frankliniella fusca TaxID=407009 RepID=A0AAE1LQP0_9NEOP|nr:hypothetical protein KUF71_016524 [Frankliniella fusca]
MIKLELWHIVQNEHILVSWLTTLLHADILSSRFDQQANSPGSWTKPALKPLLLKRIQNASLETCCIVGAAPDWMFHQEHLVTKMDQVLMSCDNVLEEKHKTKHAAYLDMLENVDRNNEYVSWLTSLLHADILTNSPGRWAKLALNHPLLHKRIQNASWETCSLILWEISEIQCFMKASSSRL